MNATEKFRVKTQRGKPNQTPFMNQRQV